MPVARWSTEATARPRRSDAPNRCAVDARGHTPSSCSAMATLSLRLRRSWSVLEARRELCCAATAGISARFEGVYIDRARVAISTQLRDRARLRSTVRRRPRADWSREGRGTVNDAEVIVGGKWLVTSSGGLLRLDLESESVAMAPVPRRHQHDRVRPVIASFSPTACRKLATSALLASSCSRRMAVEGEHHLGSRIRSTTNPRAGSDRRGDRRARNAMGGRMSTPRRA